MKNNVPAALSASSPAHRDDSLVGQAVDRSLERRRAAAREEIERLVSAALLVIERSGNVEPKVSEILAEAGLSNQAFYRHFRGKHELLVAVLDRGIRELASYLAHRMAGASSPSDAVREWIRGMAAQAQSPAGARASRPFALARGRLAEKLPEEVAATQTRVTAPLRKALEAARNTGALPAVDPERDAEALYHLLMGWVEARLLELQRPDPSEARRVESFAMAGLSRDPTVDADPVPPSANEAARERPQ